VVLDAELTVLVVEDRLEVELDWSEDDAASVLLILEIVLLLLNEDVVAKLLDVTEVPKRLEDVVPELVLLVLLNVKVVEGTRVAEEVLKLLINEDEDEMISELLEGEGVLVLVLLEEEESVLVKDKDDSEVLDEALDDGKLPVLLNDEELAFVVLNDEELVSLALEEEAVCVVLKELVVPKLEELAVPEVLALLDELIVLVLLDEVLGNELLSLLVELEELIAVLENVLHGGPVVSVLVNVAVTKSVVVYTFLA
jgi:hypothetical protein